MVTNNGVSRRQFLRALGVSGTVGVASLGGCLQSDVPEGTMGADMQPLVDMGLSAMAGSPAMGQYPATPNDEGVVDVVMAAYEDDSDNYHFMPHVAWVEPGTTVRWAHTMEGISEARTHSATAITPDLMAGYPRLIPEGADGFDSGFLPGVHGSEYQAITDDTIGPGPFTHTFEQKGVYMYVCQNHYGISGMAGAIVVGELWGENEGPGWSPGMTADLHPIVEADPVNGPVIREKIAGDLRTMIRTAGEGGGHDDGGHGGDSEGGGTDETESGDQTGDGDHTEEDEHTEEDGHDE